MILLSGRPSLSAEHGSGVVYRCTLKTGGTTRWAWASDTHICGDAAASQRGFQPARQLERAVGEMRQFQPSGVLVNGDLAWSLGHSDDYERFFHIMHPLAKRAAVVLAVGNHDDRGNLLARLANRSDRAPQWLAAVVEQPPFRLVALDSSIDSQTVGGEIGRAQLAWLEGELEAEPRSLTIVFLHHPGESSSEGCSDFSDLVGLARRRKCVQAVVTAHDHEYCVGQVGGVHHVRLPAVGFPFEERASTGWIAAVLGRAGIELRLQGSGSPAVTHLPWR
ncbi:MAG: metallophosphoesterase [Bryobacterales bacterium]|nr:metallophosphoesterase [Bryobacterales bacterium]